MCTFWTVGPHPKRRTKLIPPSPVSFVTHHRPAGRTLGSMPMGGTLMPITAIGVPTIVAASTTRVPLTCNATGRFWAVTTTTNASMCTGCSTGTAPVPTIVCVKSAHSSLIDTRYVSSNRSSKKTMDGSPSIVPRTMAGSGVASTLAVVFPLGGSSATWTFMFRPSTRKRASAMTVRFKCITFIR
jgi:hypothetical protein